MRRSDSAKGVAIASSKSTEKSVLLELTDNHIDEILGAVGGDIPAHLDRSDLKADINFSWDFFRRHERDGKSGRTRKQKLAREVSLTAKKLAYLLEVCGFEAGFEQRVNRLLVGSVDAVDPPQPLEFASKGTFRRQLLALENIERVFPLPNVVRELGLTPADWFLGHDLAAIFEGHFRLRAKRERMHGSDGPLCGPWIRFAVATAKCLGTNWTAETVSAAMTAVKKQMP